MPRTCADEFKQLNGYNERRLPPPSHANYSLLFSGGYVSHLRLLHCRNSVDLCAIFAKEEEIAAKQALHSGWVAEGSEVEHFENEMCNYLGVPDAIAYAYDCDDACN